MKLRVERAALTGALGVVDDGGSFRRFLFNGQPITTNGPEWFFESAHDLGMGLYMIEWRDLSSRIAIHYYGETLSFITNRLDHLPPHQLERLTKTVRDAAPLLWRQMTAEIAPLPNEIPAFYRELPLSLRLEILAAHQLSPDHPTQIIASAPASLADWPTLNWTHLRTLFEVGFLAVQAAAFYGAGFSLPSPFSGEPIVARSGLFVRHNGFTGCYAYRFADAAADLVFYVICLDSSRAKHADWSYSIHAIFIPKMGLVLYPNLDVKNYCDYFFWEPLEVYLYREIAGYGDILIDAMTESLPRVAAAVYFKHIGHHLWNELTGLDHVCRLGGATVPSAPIFVVESRSTEMFGRLEDLFPQFSGRIDRSIGSWQELQAYFYRSHYLLLHLTHRQISGHLATRIMTLSDEACRGTLSACHDELTAAGFRVVLLGLRVENRTVVDLLGFYRAAVAEIASLFEKVAIVVDGHNRPADAVEGGSFGSLHSQNATELDRAEADILRGLRAAFSSHSNIRFISTLQQPVAASMFWCSRATFFVSPWGAGLAKYKWVCNAPGLIVSSRSFLMSHESSLYDLPDYRENAIVSYRIDVSETADRPEATTLVRPMSPLQYNFDVNQAAVAREIRNLAADVR
jgi:hypothetical protein